MEAERKAVQAALTAIGDAAARSARRDAGYRGERLKIIDPGIVPERPSSPNLPLNVAAALLLGLVLPILWLTLRDELPGPARSACVRGGFRAVAKVREDE